LALTASLLGVIAALFRWQLHARRTIRPSLTFKFGTTRSAGDEPSDRASAHRRFDEIPWVATGDDAPARYLERVEVLVLDLGRRHRGASCLPGSPIGAVTQQLFGERASARFLGLAGLRRRGACVVTGDGVKGWVVLLIERNSPPTRRPNGGFGVFGHGSPR
jgi:hypothetical protein